MWKSQAACWNVRDGGAESDWVRAHSALTRLARERAAADADEGRWLLVAWRSGAHIHLGYGSFSEYVERLLGYSPRATREKLRVAEALESLPLSARALDVVGAAAPLWWGADANPGLGFWQRQWLWSKAASIAGGTSEVQRTIIGERMLGLPR